MEVIWQLHTLVTLSPEKTPYHTANRVLEEPHRWSGPSEEEEILGSAWIRISWLYS
jgi:hypothetical protein